MVSSKSVAIRNEGFLTKGLGCRPGARRIRGQPIRPSCGRAWRARTASRLTVNSAGKKALDTYRIQWARLDSTDIGSLLSWLVSLLKLLEERDQVALQLQKSRSRHDNLRYGTTLDIDFFWWIREGLSVPLHQLGNFVQVQE